MSTNEMESKKQGWKVVDIAIATVGVAMAMYHMLSTQYLIFGGFQHQNVHLGFALALIFLVGLKKSVGKARYYMFSLLVLGIICVTYIGINITALEARVGFNTTLDLVIGVAIVIVILESTRQSFGVILPLVTIIFMIYAFFGHYIPGPLNAAKLPVERIIPYFAIGLTGVYGQVLSISANFVFLFVFFGAVLQVSGATVFFEQVGRVVGRKMAAGPALSAVVTSALVGTTTGSIGANIATTGSFTIPLMKKAGYTPEEAGAIEAAASSGGQIMPPVMGAAAFAMAGVTGIPYLKIALAATIPAILYFFTIGLYVQFKAKRRGLVGVVEAVDYKEMLLRSPLFIIPIAAIMFFLARGNTLMYAAFWGIVLTLLLSLFRKETRGSLINWVKGFTQGSIAGAEIAVGMCCIGIVLQIITFTGIGVKLPGLVEAWSGGNLSITLLIIAVVCLILGCGVSTMAVYLIVAIVSAPILLNMGIPMLLAHFFVFFYACFAFVTPPIGMAAVIAAKVAGGKYLPTAVEAVKASAAGFIIPVLILWNPALLLEPVDSLLLAIIGVIACLVLLIVLEALFVGHYITETSLWEKISLGASLIALLGYFISNNNYLFVIVGLGFFLIITIKQYLMRGRASTQVSKTA